MQTTGKNLHSTMYLLNPIAPITTVQNDVFTFHYVSIKSKESHQMELVLNYLHSTMYLLNQRAFVDVATGAGIYIPLCIY